MNAAQKLLCVQMGAVLNIQLSSNGEIWELPVLILVKAIGGRQKGHPVQKMLTAPAKVPINNWAPS